MPDFLPFALPDIGDDEIAEVLDTLRSGWLTNGVKSLRFEADFAGFVGDGVTAVAVNSATSGLHLALEAAGVTEGDEVITSAYTFTATAEVIRHLGADPVLVDIDPATMNMDPAVLDQVIGQRSGVRGKAPKAVIPVHFAGLACDMGAIMATTEKHGLKVIEDAAHAFPATWNGTLVGALDTAAAVFSFYATKTITTGEGGMIVTKDPAIAERCRLMRLHGISQDAFERYHSPRPTWQYEVVAPGYKYNMTDLAASLGIHQLKKSWAFRTRREEMAGLYDESFRGLPLITPPRAPAGDIHAWHLYVVRILPEAPVSRDRFIELMAEEGIGCSVHFIPLHLHPYWRDRYGLRPDDFPHALNLYRQAVSLPLYTKMTHSDQERVIEGVKKILGDG
jgi:dTDP-4-amino-4,6-dideoxygalactose transaminase